jgi:tetrahydromethanopterin S-methyltransferase subunit B
MIAKNAEFLDELDNMIERIGELEVALDSLPRDIVITIRYEEIGRPDIMNTAVNETVNVNRVFVGNENLPPAVQRVNEVQGAVNRNLPGGVQNVREQFSGRANIPPAVQSVREQFSDVGGQMGLAAAQAAALRDLIRQMQEGTITSREFIAAEKELTASQFMAANMAARQANAQRQSTDAITQWWQETNQATPSGAAFAATMAAAAGSIARANAVLTPFNAATRTAATTLAIIPIATGLAAFSITSLGVAIHLIVMGIAEFLAVFLPAMYAAAAGAYVMAQGVQLVVQHINGLYTASEALGPMLGTTAGDMLGLGHSIQTAQDLANPGVFTLFGEGIGAINAFSGRASLGLDGLKLSASGARGGLTDFATVGLDVTHMLDAFGAKIVADLQGPMGGTLHQLVASATDDLRTFGQILGNLGHGILMLAAAMPGLAEVILHVVDGITALIKWFSQLPSGLLTALFVIEEMYRWSGLLAGGFGLLGRGIALLGTLGIPVFAAIGRNVATMVANVLAGISNMVANFVSGGTRIGIFGERVGRAAESITTGLGRAVTFLGGPWGVAIGLAIVAVGALVFWMSRAKDSTQQWIDTAQQAVTKATNLQVLNVIAQQMAASNTKLADANAQLNQSNLEVTKGAGQAATKITQQQDALIKQGQAAGQAAGQTQVYTQKQIDGTNAAAAASTKINELTGYQKNLVMEQTHVEEGAAQISKAYRVDFVTALGLADMAGVKLSTSIGKNGQLTAQAAIQIGALVLGYEKMDQTGGILANSMGAVNIQAGIQASKVGQLNQAWDQFIQMGTGLTGTFTQLNLDLEQMGNQAPTVGSKIKAFTGGTQMSVSQIAASLKSFSGTSAQVWQSYNQSVTQANSFTDALRVASAAGVVTQKQYGQAVASVVGQLLPYAGSSKAALAELTMIAQEAGGPAYNTTKSLTSNYQSLKNWTDQNAVSSQQFGNMLNTLEGKITNVSKVAQGFAGTLQSDVLNAMAQAGSGTTRITQLTDAYTTALTKNGAQSPQAKAAQEALTKALEAYGFKASDITQMENILSQSYVKNTASIAGGAGTRLNLQKDVEHAINTVPTAKSDFDRFTQSILNHTSTTRAGEATRQALINDLIKSGVNASTAKNDVNNMATAIRLIPKTASLNIKESGSGIFTITEAGKNFQISAGGLFSPHASGGPIEHGSGPKSDDVLIRASRGEYVMQAAAVNKYGSGMMDAINAGAYASGGLIASFNKSGGPAAGIAAQLGSWTDTASNDFAGVMAMTMENAAVAIEKAAISQQKAAQAAMVGTGVGGMGDSGARTRSAAVAQAYARSLMGQYGWAQSQMNYLIPLWNQESGWSAYAVNKSSGAYGIPQALGHGHPYNLGDYKNQIIWGLNYIKNSPRGDLGGRPYGSPQAAWAHEVAHNWYDNGGFLPPGLSLAMNGTGRPERVTPPGGELSATTPIHVHVMLDGKQIFTAVQDQTFRYNMRNRGQITGGLSPLNK